MTTQSTNVGSIDAAEQSVHAASNAIETDVNPLSAFKEAAQGISDKLGFDPDGWGPTAVMAGMGMLGVAGLQSAWSAATGDFGGAISNAFSSVMNVAMIGGIVGMGLKVYEGWDPNQDMTTNLQAAATDIKTNVTNTLGMNG